MEERVAELRWFTRAFGSSDPITANAQKQPDLVCPPWPAVERQMLKRNGLSGDSQGQASGTRTHGNWSSFAELRETSSTLPLPFVDDIEGEEGYWFLIPMTKLPQTWCT